MHRTTGFQHTIPGLFAEPAPGRSTSTFGIDGWEAPTFGEFVRRLEHEFGQSVDLSTLPLTRADDGDSLSPRSIRALCELLGVPPEDFGV